MIWLPLGVIVGRAPHGARGLKFIPSFIRRIFGRSRPARGAWIEISRKKGTTSPALSRAPHGARGLKSRTWPRTSSAACRAPHGARGLKFQDRLDKGVGAGRAPHGARGLKSSGPWMPCSPCGRAPHGARGLKSRWQEHLATSEQSRPARGAWIEIWQRNSVIGFLEVAPRTGRVD